MSKTDQSSKIPQGGKSAEFYRDALKTSAKFRDDYDARVNVVQSADMPFERSPDGLIQHIIHQRMDTKECCIEAYMQFLPPGEQSGKHRHLTEEVLYVVEGSGYDLHWDLKFDCADEFVWEWEEKPRKFEWEHGDFIYVPPYSMHQHFNPGKKVEARLIVITNRILKDMGFDWFEQVEHAEGF